jgi:hypothetical protein
MWSGREAFYEEVLSERQRGGASAELPAAANKPLVKRKPR